MANVKLALVTTCKQDIFDVAETLAAGIDGKFMQDAEAPVIIGVNGSIDTGKKIIPDAMRDKILKASPQRQFVGRSEYDEFWTGSVHGKMVEIDFINVAWKYGYLSPGLVQFPKGSNSPRQLQEAFLEARKHGGISFIHNAQSPLNCSIKIWMENDYGIPVCNHELKGKNSGLAGVFERAGFSGYFNPWARYIEIAVRDKEMLATPQMQAALETLREGVNAVKQVLDKADRTDMTALKNIAAKRPYKNRGLG